MVFGTGEGIQGTGFGSCRTGGGCDCLEYLTESNIFVITDGEPSAPVDEANGFWLGVYHQDMDSQPDPIAEFDANTVAECAAKFRELIAQ